ncbi:hypothetical protein B5S28_g2876 [[Candida] boidinii]|uniref:Unnamed protein product n=1 Tax=Candida boidinii TaxID=5477 RepID=A0ACB5U275_CANBO|nr:hypothetical protein B5S28_g2876 [[Candida] boidinii]OWB62858.1 hypothetical protein B5S29_g3805 [[Candida] boidinii]OWB73806.1 hypothetical protein B5S31_g3569 [[Candida] boidinii]OWB79677.1 hypothetical protein B5S32_g3910 [[Candida] boidinii]GME99991.1 unnamed protein product [[Candida] boidinii]
MGCFKFCLVFIPTVLSFAAFILTILASAGSTKNNLFATSVFLIQLDCENATLSSITTGLTSTDITLKEAGLSEVYTFGMWGYCEGNHYSNVDSTGYVYDDDIKMTSCSKPVGFYTFDLADFFSERLQEAGYQVDPSSIAVPDGITTYTTTSQNISKMIFITCLLAIIVCFFVLVLGLLGIWCNSKVLFLVAFLSMGGFLLALLSVAGATGMYTYIKNQFNSNSDTYQIKASLSSNYLALAWVGTVCYMLNVFFWFLNSCVFGIGSTRTRARIVHEPIAEFREKV